MMAVTLSITSTVSLRDNMTISNPSASKDRWYAKRRSANPAGHRRLEFCYDIGTLRALIADCWRSRLNAMKLRWLCLLNIALGILAGAVVACLRLLDGVADGSSTSHSLPLDRILEPVSAALIVIGTAGTLLATAGLGLALRRAGRSAEALLRAQPKKPLSASDWINLLASVHTLGHDRTTPPRRSSNPADAIATFSPAITRRQLLRLHWRNLGVMQVWTSTAVLLLEGLLVAWWWHPSPNPSTTFAALTPVALGILVFLLLVVVTRLLIGNRVDRFLRALGPPRPLGEATDRALPLHAAGPFETDQTAAGSPPGTFPLTAPMRIDTPTPKHRPQETSLDETGSCDVGTRASSEQAFPSARTSQTSSWSDAHKPAVLDPQLAEIFTAIDHLRAQQDAMKDAIQALADSLHGIAETHFGISEKIDTTQNWGLRLQELIENMSADARAVEGESRQETSNLRDEMRERHEAQQRIIADVCASLNRLETRIIPALRRVSSVSRVMTILVERLRQIEKHYVQPNSINPEQSEHGGSEQALPTRSSMEIGVEHGIVVQLRQLMSELDDATADAKDLPRRP
jgi:archaellum component FlaC